MCRIETGAAPSWRAALTPRATSGTILICAFAQIKMVGATGIEPVTPPV